MDHLGPCESVTQSHALFIGMGLPRFEEERHDAGARNAEEEVPSKGSGESDRPASLQLNGNQPHHHLSETLAAKETITNY
jgi:hypothetical protein